MKLQQGDVILTAIDYEIKGEKLDHMILAEGEATGHCHKIVSGIGQLIMMDKIMHLQIFSETALLEHNEHGPIQIPKGNYRIDRVREYDHFEEETRRVAD